MKINIIKKIFFKMINKYLMIYFILFKKKKKLKF